MSKMNGERIYELMANMDDALILDSIPTALLAGTAVGSAAGAQATGAAPAGMEHTYLLTPTETPAPKGGFGGWLKGGGWIALTAGIVAAIGIAVGGFALMSDGENPAGTDPIGTGESATPIESDTEEPSQEVTEAPTEEETSEEETTEGETAEPHDVHTYGAWSFLLTPSCTEGGTRQRVCTVENCGASETEDWPAGLHAYGDGDTCTLCGHTWSIGNKLLFTTNGDGTCSAYTINVNITELVIPNYSKSGDLVVALDDRFASKLTTKLTSVTLPEGLRVIGDRAFYNCMALTSVNFPATLQTIGSQAFTGAGITSAELPEGLTSIGDIAFFGCKMTELTIPSTVTEMGKEVFGSCPVLSSITFAEGFAMTSLPVGFAADCPALTNVQLPATLTVIGDEAFRNDTALQTMDLPAGLLSIGKQAFSACPIASLTIPEGVTELGEEAFGGNPKLQTVTIPASVTSMGSYLFTSCSALTEIIFAEGSPITEIPIGFAAGCKSLTSIDLTSMTVIGRNAFSKTGFTSLTLPAGMVSLGEKSFTGSALTEIVIPASVTELGDSCFSSCAALKTVTFAEGSTLTRIPASFVASCPELTAVILPDSLTVINDSAFWNCPKLPMTEHENGLYLAMGDNPYAILCAPVSDEITSFTSHPNTVYIAGGAFNHCEALTEVTLNEGLISLGAMSFNSCYVLTAIHLPASLRVVGDEAFSGCGLLELTMPGGVTYIGSAMFETCRLMEKLHFQGTLAEWEAIEKHEEWISRYDDYTLICTDGELTIKAP